MRMHHVVQIQRPHVGDHGEIVFRVSVVLVTVTHDELLGFVQQQFSVCVHHAAYLSMLAINLSASSRSSPRANALSWTSCFQPGTCPKNIWEPMANSDVFRRPAGIGLFRSAIN